MNDLSRYWMATLLLANTATATEPVWERALGAPIVATPVVMGERVLVAAGQSLVALDPDGTTVWKIEMEGELLSTPLIAEQRIYVHSSTGLTALNKDREQLWHYPAEDQGALVDGRTWGWGNALLSDPWEFYRSSPVVTESAIIFGASDGVHAVESETGTRLWHQSTAPVTAGIVKQDDTILVADWNNRLRRFNIADGALQWSFTARLPAPPYNTWIGWTGLNLTPVIADGQVFFGSRSSYFYALNLEKGTELWSSKHGTSWIGSPGVVHEKQVYFGLSDGKALIGIERGTGTQTLFVPTPGPVFATPIVAGNHLIAGTLSGELLIVDLNTGRLIATHRLHDSNKPFSSYFTPDPDSDLTPFQFTVANLKKMKTEQRAVLSLAIIGELVLLGTGSGDVLAFELDGLLKSR